MRYFELAVLARLTEPWACSRNRRSPNKPSSIYALLGRSLPREPSAQRVVVAPKHASASEAGTERIAVRGRDAGDSPRVRPRPCERPAANPIRQDPRWRKGPQGAAPRDLRRCTCRERNGRRGMAVQAPPNAVADAATRACLPTPPMLQIEETGPSHPQTRTNRFRRMSRRFARVGDEPAGWPYRGRCTRDLRPQD